MDSLVEASTEFRDDDNFLSNALSLPAEVSTRNLAPLCNPVQPERTAQASKSSNNMSTGVLMVASGVKINQSSQLPMASNRQSLLHENISGRRSTPDSEALASSDDEGERQGRYQPRVASRIPVRRSSWLNDNTQPTNHGRKNSFTSSMSPATSHPSTPSAEPGTWGSHSQSAVNTGRGASSFPWGNTSAIWNNDTRKEPPSRLTEVLPSPTSGRPASNGYYSSEAGRDRDHVVNTTLPFAIPLHPTPKTYRSQSYSVGQLDSDLPAGPPPPSAPQNAGRGRTTQHSGLHHRPSRPSMLSEMSNDGGLARLKEVEDDDSHSTNSSTQGIKMQSTEAKRIEYLTWENAMLRQQKHQSRMRRRSSTANAYGLSNSSALPNSLPEVSDSAVDELDELQELQEANPAEFGRRISDFGTAQSRIAHHASAEDRKLEHVKKAFWQSSLGFGGAGDYSQSRRHSFADVPTRHGSVGSIGEPLSARETTMHDAVSPRDHQYRYQENSSYALNDHGEQSYDLITRRKSLFEQAGGQLPDSTTRVTSSQPSILAASYLGGAPPPPRNVDSFDPALYRAPQHFSSQVVGFGNRRSSPHGSTYGVPQPRHNQLLYMVLFKCSRADVFYVQEGTGLSIKPGELVIVEADRGTDLGTVAQDNVDWATAKNLKEHYAEEHYKWLMMYSHGAAGSSDGTGAGLMASTNGQSSAVGGMGPQTQHGMQEPNSSEIKPKIIKRVAQPHEIQSLRDKEGNEAKAKRVCMQKVKEHGLHMEILDAEFQMDWKKLTFYYFADTYINFNSLVTDLFKVYKTRIWMSAINPASFASPALGLQAPSGIGPGAVGVNRNIQPTQRQHQHDQHQNSYINASAGHDYQGVFAQPLPFDHGSVAAPSFQPSGFSLYSQYNTGARNMNNAQTSFMGSPMMDHFAGFQTGNDYQGLPPPFASPGLGADGHENGFRRQGTVLETQSNAWVPSLQGLSLNSH